APAPDGVDRAARHRLPERQPGGAGEVAALDGVRGGASGARAATEPPAQEVLDVRGTAGGAVAHAGAPTGAGPAAEHPAEQVLETVGPGTAGTGGEPRSAAGHGAQRVVLLTLLGVGEHRVGLADLLEPGLGLRVALVLVGVMRARELAVGLLDLGGVGVLGDTERGVEVLLQPVLPGHASPPPVVVVPCH